MSESAFRYTYDELNAILFGEQGFLVVGSIDAYKVGDIVRPHHEITTPMRVTGPSDYREFHDQCVRACLLDTCKPLTGLVDRWPNYYRVVAAD